MAKLFFIILLFLALLNSAIGQKATDKDISKFIPNGYTLLDSASGDLTGDGYKDLILILKDKNEDSNGDATRPLIILIGNKQGGYTFFTRNDSVVLCKGCGGSLGDPYEDTKIKSRYFSIEHYGGDAERWSRIITFEYDIKDGRFKLHRDGGDVYELSTSKKVVSRLYNKQDFNKLDFKDYSNEKGDSYP